MKNHGFDLVDLKIIDVLQTRGKISSAQIGDLVGLSETACYNRLRRIESAKIIRHYSAQVNLKHLDYHVFFTHVALEKDTSADLAFFEKQIGQTPEIVECHYITGALDYLLKTVAADFDSYIALVDRLREANPNIRRYETLIQVREVKNVPAPLEFIHRKKRAG